MTRLFDDPSPYMGKRVCTVGYIQVEREAMVLLPAPAPNNVPYAFEIGIEMGFGDAVDLGLRAFDRVAVEGRLMGNASCVPGTIFCWGAPIGFAEPTVTLLDRPDPWEICSQITLDDLTARPQTYKGEMICTEGILASAFLSLELQSIDVSDASNEQHTFPVETIHIRDGTERRLAGDRISVAGYFDGRALEAHEIRVIEARHIADECIETTIAEIYAAPAMFNFEPVCFEGYISRVEPGMGIVDEVPNVDPAMATHSRIYALLPYGPSFDAPAVSAPARTIRGVIAIDDGNANDLSLEELEARYADEPIFVNANVPMTLIVYEVE